MIVYVIEFPEHTLQYPEVWGDRDQARERFLELYEEYGDQDAGLYDSWTETDYMSFDDEGEYLYSIKGVTMQGITKEAA